MSPQEEVFRTLRQFLRLPALKPAKKRLLVAVSGGADSVALLRAVTELGPALGWQVDVLHCDHGLRAQSGAEARFVDALCHKLDVSLYAYKAKLKKGAGLEERARHWRRSCYEHAALRSGARLILLAHHAQDQAETLILNLVRGAGSAGAQAMRPLAPMKEGSPLLLGRPFLGLNPQVLRDYLRGLKQAWKEDASNRDTKHARNHVRHEVLPRLLSVNPQAVKNLADFAARAQAGKPERDLAGLLKLSSSARGRAQEVLRQG
jgi:tRNA(Ile)-lysidine synthase